MNLTNISYVTKSIVISIATLLILSGCQTVRVNPIAKEQLENLKPFNLVANSVENPSISYYSSTDSSAMMMGYQGGAIGGALTYLVISAKKEQIITEREEMLGSFWKTMNTVNFNKCLQNSFNTWNATRNGEWFNSVEIVQDQNILKNQIQPDNHISSIQLIAATEFAMNLSYVSFSAEYSGYWSSIGATGTKKQISNKIHNIVFAPRGSILPESNATEWNKAVTNPQGFVTDGYYGLAGLIGKDLRLPSYFDLKKQPILSVWGISGRLVGYEGEDQIFIRNRSEELYSIPIPKIINRTVRSVAIKKSPEDEHEDLSLILYKLLKSKGFEVDIVEDIDPNKNTNLYISISSDWKWDFGTFLSSASISLIDPGNHEMIGFGSASPGGMKMIKHSAEKVIGNCWEDAFEQDLRDEIERISKYRTENSEIRDTSSPLGS